MAEQVNAAEEAAEDQDDASGGDERLAFRGPIQQVLTRPEIGALLGAVAVWMLFWLASESFGTAGGTANFLDVAAILGIMAVPVALLMIGGEFDLSSGSMTGATAMLVVLLSKDVGEFGGAGLSLHVAVPVTFAFALLIGWFNGTMVEKTSLPSFIVTLGTFFILIGGKLGVAKLFTDKVIVEGLDEADGYDFWNDLFGAVWLRNNHVWDGRDWAWALLLILGGVGLLLAVFDLTFQHRRQRSAAAVPVLAAGAAGTTLGVILLLTTGGTGGDWISSIVVAAGALVGVVGWCRWRYEPAERLSGAVNQRTLQIAAGGLGLIVLGIVLAAVMDASNEDQLGFLGGAGGRWVLMIGIFSMGVLAVLASNGVVPASAPVLGAALVAIPGISFLVTVQGARAILFVGLAITGLLLLGAAARSARRTNSLMSLQISGVTAAAMAVLALFIRSEGDSRKIRVELMATVLLAGLAIFLMAVAMFLSATRRQTAGHAEMGEWSRWAGMAGAGAFVISLIFEFGDFGPALLDAHAENGTAYTIVASIAKGGIVALAVYTIGVLVKVFTSDDDGIGNALAAVSAAAVSLGITAKLLFITQLEADATQAVTRYRVSVLYYLIFAAVGAWLLVRTQFGSWTFAVGGNKDAARSVGVPAAQTKTSLFMMVSAAAFVTGMVIAFRLNSVQSNVGDGNEFRYIIVAVVGGCLLTGGYGSVAGAALGAAIWGMITQGIGFSGWNTDWRFLVLGALLLVAVIVNNYVRNRAERMSA